MSDFISAVGGAIGLDLISEPSAFLVTELTGSKHELELVGRALPYRPYSLEGRMRAEFTWYPGNPVSTVQMLGAEEAPTSITGTWKDRFIRQTNDLGIPILSGGSAVASLDGSPIADVRSLVRVVDGFRLRGQLLEVRWDEQVRHGILTRFKHTWLRREDVEWEMEFQWISRGEPEQPIAFGINIPPLDIASEVSEAVTTLKEAAEAPFNLITSISSAIASNISTIEIAASAITQVARKAAATTSSPDEVTQAIASSFETIKRESQEINDTMETVPAKAMINTTNVGALGQGAALEAEDFKRGLKKSALALRNLAANRSQELQAGNTKQAGTVVFRARDPQDLRDVSTRFYGTPDEWRSLMLYNGLATSKLSAGQVIIVPTLNREGTT